jgi:putative inorganic carbon (HCO3(-)) transporter
MLRLALVLFLIGVGVYCSLQAPFYGLLFYMGNAYFRPEEWVWSGLIGSLHLSLIIGSYVVIVTLFSKHKLICNGQVCLIALFVLHSLLSTAMSDEAGYCWPYLLEFIKVAVITYLIIVLTTDIAKLRLVIMVMIMALGLEQAKQGWLYLLTFQRNTNPISFLGDNNGVAVGMFMLLPLTGFVIGTTHDKLAKGLFGFTFLGCFLRALATYSRGGFLSAIGLGLIWWLRSFQKFRVAVAMIVMVLIVWPMLPGSFWKRMETIETYAQDEDKSALGRLHYWDVAYGMAAANPFLGIGFSGYNRAYDDFDFSEGLYGRGRSVHNSYLGVLAELGYPGFFLYITILLCALKNCEYVRRLASRNEVPMDIGKSGIALEASLIVFVVGGSFIPFQYNEMVWHIIGLSIALRQIASKSLAGQTVVSADARVRISA